MPGRRGQPSRFTEERGESIIAVMRLGTFLKDAATYTGVHVETISNWLKAGAKARDRIDRGREVTPEEKLLADFSIGFEKATTTWKMEALSKLTQSDDIKALMWRLERRFPEEWGNRQKVTIEDKNDDERSRARKTIAEYLERGADLAADPIRGLYGVVSQDPGQERTDRPASAESAPASDQEGQG